MTWDMKPGAEEPTRAGFWLSAEQAATLVNEVFGPCTIVGECLSIQNVLEEVNEEQGGDIRGWLRAAMTAQSVSNERWFGPLGDEPGRAEEHRAAVTEADEMEAALAGRVAAWLKAEGI